MGSILDSVQIVFDHSQQGLFGTHRRISKVRRTRLALRRLQKQHPNIEFVYSHSGDCVYVLFASARDLFMFGLVWTLPQQWSVESHMDIDKFNTTQT